MKEEFRKIAQSYIGMTPKDKGCNTWLEMQNKMADELNEVATKFQAPMVDAVKYCLEKIDNSEHWWISSPDRGGLDVEFLQNAININCTKEAPLILLDEKMINKVKRKYDFWCNCIVRDERNISYFRICNLCNNRCVKSEK